MASKEQNLMNVVTSGLIVASVGTGYALASNEGLRRAGLSYTGRALWSGGGGVVIGLIVGMWAPRIGIGVFTGGFISGAVNGMAAYKMARYRGTRDSSSSRGELPAATAAQLPPPTAPLAERQAAWDALPADQRAIAGARPVAGYAPRPQQAQQPVRAIPDHDPAPHASMATQGVPQRPRVAVPQQRAAAAGGGWARR